MAKVIKAQPLTHEAFAKYGSYNNITQPGNWPFVGEDDSDVKFFRDMALAEFGCPTSIAFSNTQVKKRPLEVQFIEIHNYTCEGMLVLDNDCVMHVGQATPNGTYPDELEAFIVPAGTFVVIRPGVWHHAPFVLEADVANTLIVLPELTYANDCTVHEYKQGECPVIEI